MPLFVEPPVAGAVPDFGAVPFWMVPDLGAPEGSEVDCPPLLGPTAFDLLAEAACEVEAPILPADDCFVEDAGLTLPSD